jgi:hypothetical protein
MWRRCLLMSAICILFGCSREPPVRPGTQLAASSSSEKLPAIVEALAHGTDPAAIRASLQQLNTYLAREPGMKPATLTEAERDLLRSHFRLDDDELREVDSPQFTPLDVAHLEQCLLLRDAVQSLELAGLAPRRQASLALAWVGRQVQLRDTDAERCPPLFVLRRGWGSAVERAFVFLTVLHQLGIDGCLIGSLPTGPGPSAPRYWAVGALVDGEVRLFDLRQATPLPGSSGIGTATLAQVRAGLDPPAGFTLDLERRAELPRPLLRQGEVYLAWPLSALAPRMRQLEQLLAGTEPVRLGIDAGGMLKTWQDALRSPGLAGCRVHVGSLPGAPNSPVRLLRSFLPPDEGGTDRTFPSRRHQAEVGLVPWDHLPEMLRDLPGPAGERLNTAFARPFVSLALAPGMPRDLLLRGQLDEAVRKLVELRDQLARPRQRLRTEPNLHAQVAAWCAEARTAHEDLLRAEQVKGPDTAALRERARQRTDAVWQKRQKAVLLVEAAVAEGAAAEVAYLLALCQHEKAERAHARRSPDAGPAWKAAAERWQAYLEEYPGAPAAAAARQLQARALQMATE